MHRSGIWRQGQEVGAIADEQKQREDPHAIESDPCYPISLQTSEGLLVDAVLEVHECGGIDVVEGLELGEGEAEAVQKADGVGPPGNVTIDDDGRNDEQTGNVVYEEALLADGVAAVNEVLDGYVVDVVE